MIGEKLGFMVLVVVMVRAWSFSFVQIEKDGGMEKLSVEFSELERSKRQLLHLLEQRDAEIAEKNALLKTYYDKIVSCSPLMISLL